MVEPPVEVRGQGVLAGVTPGAVATVVTEGDGLGQGHVEPAGPGDARGHLGHFQGVGQAGALVVVGEHEDLGLAGQPAEGRGVEDPVPIPLEAGPPAVGLLGPVAVSGPGGPGGRRGQPLEVDLFPGLALQPRVGAGPTGAGVAVGVGEGDPGPPWPAMVEAQRRFRSFSPASGSVPVLSVPGLSIQFHRASVHHGCDRRL